jgi:hypothetical protein
MAREDRDLGFRIGQLVPLPRQQGPAAPRPNAQGRRGRRVLEEPRLRHQPPQHQLCDLVPLARCCCALEAGRESQDPLSRVRLLWWWPEDHPRRALSRRREELALPRGDPQGRAPDQARHALGLGPLVHRHRSGGPPGRQGRRRREGWERGGLRRRGDPDARDRAPGRRLVDELPAREPDLEPAGHDGQPALPAQDARVRGPGEGRRAGDPIPAPGADRGGPPGQRRLARGGAGAGEFSDDDDGRRRTKHASRFRVRCCRRRSFQTVIGPAQGHPARARQARLRRVRLVLLPGARL